LPVAPDSIHLQHGKQELGQFEHARGDRFGARQARRVLGEQFGPVVTHHAGAGTGGHHDRPGAGKQRQLPAGDGARFVGETGGVGRLAATGLVLRVMDADAFAFDQLNGGDSGLGIEQVEHAGAEQIRRSAWRNRGVAAGAAITAGLLDAFILVQWSDQFAITLVLFRGGVKQIFCPSAGGGFRATG
jgi:hypothetical protein